jgi:hypothetical protein
VRKSRERSLSAWYDLFIAIGPPPGAPQLGQGKGAAWTLSAPGPAFAGTLAAEACPTSSELIAVSVGVVAVGADADPFASPDSTPTFSFASGCPNYALPPQSLAAIRQRVKTIQRFMAAARRSQPPQGRMPMA